MSVFISHITEDSELATALKQWIETTLLGQYEVFVSSDGQSIPAGKKWLSEIKNAIAESKVMLVLCSPTSINRPWINFEAGCACARNLPTIPICYRGLKRDHLPQPLAELQAIEFDEGFPEKLFNALSTHLGVKRLPRIDYREMFEELSSAEAKTARGHSGETRQKAEREQFQEELEEEQVEILRAIAGLDRYLSAQQIANVTKLNKQRAKLHLDKLAKSGYVHDSLSSDRPTEYNLQQKGREYLFKLGYI